MTKDKTLNPQKNNCANSSPDKNNLCLIDDITDMLETVLLSVFVVLLIFTFVFKIVTVEGTSMYPSLSDGDKLIVSFVGYTPKIGDVVTINSYTANILDENQNLITNEGLNKRIVKRIIATSGQTIDIDFDLGSITIDGKIIYENYINEKTTRDEFAFEYPVTVPEGYAFVMGDNRVWSKDSRHPSIGFVPLNDIAGKIVFRLYPFDTLGIIK